MSSEQDPSPSDAELFVRMCHGDEGAYRLLYRRHEMVTYRVALLMARSAPDAEEIASTALLELWRKRAKVRIVDDSVRPWLLRVVSFTAKNHMRGRMRYQRLLRKIPYDGEAPDHADEVASAMDTLRVTEDVRRALRELDEKDATVLLLCVVNELSMRDAAVALGLPEGTVKSRLSRAKARLRTRLAQHAPRIDGAEA